jgi:hypothetical protein
MRTHLTSWMLGIGMLILTVPFTGCDTATPDAPVQVVRYHGVPHRAAGAAVLRPAGDETLEVSLRGKEGGVSLPVATALGGDLLFQPARLQPDGLLMMDLNGTLAGESKTLSRITHRPGPDHNHTMAVDFSTLAARQMTFECRNQGEVVYRQEHIPVEAGTPVVSADTEPTSYHFIIQWINGEKIIIVYVDYDNSSTGDGGGEEDIKDEGDGVDAGTARVAPAFAPGLNLTCSHLGFIPEVDLNDTISVEEMLLWGRGLDKLTLTNTQVGRFSLVP